MKFLPILLVILSYSCIQVHIEPNEKKEFDNKGSGIDAKTYDSLLHLNFTLLERATLFTNMLIHQSEILIGEDTTKKIQPFTLGLKYEYPTVYYAGKLDSLRKTIDFQNPLVLDFVLADSIRYYSQIQYLLIEQSTGNYKSYVTRIDLKTMPSGKTGEYAKTVIFGMALNMPYSIDSSTTNLKYTIHTFHPSTMQIYNFSKELAESCARVLYLYLLRDSKKYEGCSFEMQNINEYGYTETYVFTYPKNDVLFTTIKQAIQLEKFVVY